MEVELFKTPAAVPSQTDKITAEHNRLRAIGFKPGNPGRPKGAKNHSTRVREALLSQVGRQAIARFKHRLNKSSSPKEFEKALDQVISLLGPGKPLVAIDQSQHTHFTVVLDGQQPAA